MQRKWALGSVISSRIELYHHLNEDFEPIAGLSGVRGKTRSEMASIWKAEK